MNSEGSAFAFDLGGTHIRGGISRPDGTIFNIKKERLRSFLDGDSTETIMDNAISYIAKFVSETEMSMSSNAPIVVAVPGPVQAGVRLLDAPTLIGQQGSIPDIKEELEARTRRRVILLNDISAATWYLSRVVADDRFLVVTVSSGIGSKIFDRNHPMGVLDNVEYAGEIGHLGVVYFPEKLRCDCGGWNHVGALSSGRGILRLIRLWADRDPITFRNSLVGKMSRGNPMRITNEDHVVPAIEARDPWTTERVGQATIPLAQAILTLWLGIGLTRIVVIGGFALAAGRAYLDILQAQLLGLADYQLIRRYRDTLIVLGRTDEEACLLGAATYASRIGPRH